MHAPRRSRLLATFAVAAVVAVALSGCAGKAAAVKKTPVSSYAGEPKGVVAPASSAGGAPWATWMDASGSEFAVTLYGAAQCPPKALSYKVTAPDEITITTAKADASCADGYTPWTTIFQTPPSVDRKVTIQFTAQQVHFYLPPVKKKK